jgi:hypothetical protein
MFNQETNIPRTKRALIRFGAFIIAGRLIAHTDGLGVSQ